MSMNNPAGPGATPGTGQQPGATGPTSQGPNDPIQPPANGGTGTQPATGAPQDQSADDDRRRQQNRDEALSRMAQERDEARRLLEEERRKGLTPEELQRLRALDEKDKQRDQREKNLVLRYEIAARAPKFGIVDPEAAVMFIEKSTSVVIGDDFKVTGLDEALKDLIKERPYLANKQTPPGVDAGAGSAGTRTGGGKVTMNDIIRGAARGTPIRQEEK